MDNFSFLDNLELSEVNSAPGRVAKKAPLNPENADLRLFKDGSLYPSTKLVAEFNLEYLAEDAEGVENGFDLIDSKIWGMLPEGTPRFLAIATVSKHEARKPMLFGKARKKDGKPVQSVLEQGSTASGNQLAEYAEEVLNVTFGDDQEYMDFNILREHKIASANGVYNFPYVQKKGEAAGTIKSVRRENCEIFPLVVAILETEEVPMETPVEELN